MFSEHPISWDDEKVARLWDWYAKTHPFRDMYFAKLFGDQILRSSMLPLEASISILDFGCGPGFLWDHLRQLNSNWRYTGVDFSPDSVRQLDSRGASDEHFLGARHIAKLPTPFDSGSFDAVFLIEVVEHINDSQIDATLEESRRLLKRGGLLIVTTPNDENLDASKRFCPECGAIFHEWQHIRAWSAASLRAAVEARGFRTVLVQPRDFYARNLAQTGFNGLRRFLKRRQRPHLLGVFAH